MWLRHTKTLAKRSFARASPLVSSSSSSSSSAIGQLVRAGAANGSQRWLSRAASSRRHVIAALVVNQPGCLAEIANLFAARGYNIDSLVVGQTEVEELSRMTVVMTGSDDSAINMKRQLEDVVYVAVVNILTRSDAARTNLVERDLLLAKISTSAPGSRAEVVELASLFDAKVVDVRTDQVMVQLAGSPDQIETFLELVKPFGITEIHRSGVIAMARRTTVSEKLGELSLEGATRSIMADDDGEDVDSTMLPPG